MRYISIGIRSLLTLAFLAAGCSKIFGIDMMVKTFEQIGIGQWFRYVTGFVEVLGVILLWLPNRQAFGAALLGATMVGAVLTHIFILEPSSVPAIGLGFMTALILYLHRSQILELQKK